MRKISTFGNFKINEEIDINALIKSDEALFNIIKRKILSYGIIKSVEWLNDSKRIFNTVIDKHDDGEVSDDEFKSYMEHFYSAVVHIKHVCDKEFIPNKELYNILYELIEKSKSYI